MCTDVVAAQMLLLRRRPRISAMNVPDQDSRRAIEVLSRSTDNSVFDLERLAFLLVLLRAAFFCTFRHRLELTKGCGRG